MKQGKHKRAMHHQADHQDVWRHPLADIPEIGFIGRDSFRHVKNSWWHRHGDLIEICYIERGTVHWCVEETIHQTSGGTVFITWPDEFHGGVDDRLYPCTLYWLGLHLPKKAPTGYLGLPDQEGKTLHRALTSLPARCFTAPSRIARLYDRIFHALETRHDLTPTIVRSTVMMLLLEIIHHGTAGNVTKHGFAPQVRQAIKIMESNLQYPVPLPSIANQVGWSIAHFKVQFRRATGQTPAVYYMRRRIALALRLIQTSDKSFLDIAMAAGFSSSQYMSTCFRRILGWSPSEVRLHRKHRTSHLLSP